MKWLKAFLPKTLFMRALLIVVLPTLLVQIVAAYIFYDRHWDNVTRRMGASFAGEIAFAVNEAYRVPGGERIAVSRTFQKATGIASVFEKDATLRPEGPNDLAYYPYYRAQLHEMLTLPFAIYRDEGEGSVTTAVQFPGGVLSFVTTYKRLESGTPLIVFLWMTGSSLVFLLIAILFLRNQVRPIRNLAWAAEQFGKGGDIPADFKPSGAAEVRRATRAFLVMRERILRQIRSRTEMLAGISHDLRTPLTRIKLHLALLEGSGELRELEGDVTQMEHMIQEYLDFARGDGGEETSLCRLRDVLEALLARYRQAGHSIPLSMPEEITLHLRPRAFTRLMQNLIDNALRYGKTCALEARVAAGRAEIAVEDAGPGIPAGQREEVFRPFARLEASRNSATGGVGLGLSIARDIARAHGGNIMLEEAAAGGLRALVKLPL